MADDVDIASDLEQIRRDAAIAHVANKKPAAIANGLCQECGAALVKGARWCDNDCRDDWQRWNPGL